MEKVYEQFFSLKYYGGWSFFETYNLPVNVRIWFLERLVKQKKDEAEAVNASNRRASSGRGKSFKS